MRKASCYDRLNRRWPHHKVKCVRELALAMLTEDATPARPFHRAQASTSAGEDREVVRAPVSSARLSQWKASERIKAASVRDRAAGRRVAMLEQPKQQDSAAACGCGDPEQRIVHYRRDITSACANSIA